MGRLRSENYLENTPQEVISLFIMRLFWLAVAILLFYSCPAWCEGKGRIVRDVTAEGACVVTGISAEQCQLLALQRARASAIEQVAGIRVSSHTVVSDMRLAVDFIRTYSTGYIIKEKVLEWKLDTYQKDSSTPPVPEYIVKLSADVYIPEKKSTSLGLEAKLNGGVFRQGEKAAITIRTSKKAKIAIFNITAEDKVIMLFPSDYERENTIEGLFIFPPKNSITELEMSTLTGHKRDAEAFFISAVDDGASGVDFRRLFSPLQPVGLSEFFRRYSEIADYAEDVIISYEVINE